MPDHNDLLIKGDVREINAVVAKFLPFARAGLKVDEASDAVTLRGFIAFVRANPGSEEAKRLGDIKQIAEVEADIKQAAAAFSEYGPLLSVLVNHHVVSRIQYKLAELGKTFQAEWQSKIDRLSAHSADELQRLRDEQITILSNKIKALFKEFDRENDYSKHLTESLKFLDNLQSPNQLDAFFKDLIEAIQLKDQRTQENAAILDANEARVNGKAFCEGRSSARDVTRLDKFQEALEVEGVVPELAKFMTHQFNQGELMRGSHFLLNNTFQPVLRTLGAGYPVRSYNFTRGDSDNSAIMTFENCIFDFEKDGPRELQVKASLQYRFTYFPEKEGAEQYQIELLSSPTLQVKDQAVHALYLESKGPTLVAKVRKGLAEKEDKLEPHEKRLLDQDLAQYLLENKKLDQAKVDAANDKYLFLLMHNKREYADQILERGLPDQFFNRVPVAATEEELLLLQAASEGSQAPVDPNASYIAIEDDLVRVANKHYLSDTVRNETNQYLTWIRLFKRYRETEAPATSQKKAEIYRSIIAGLSGPDVTKRHLESAMLSIKDRGFVRDLMGQREIRNRLCGSVLTHFALQDKETAAKLLEPTWWERTRLKIASFFVNKLPQGITKFFGITTKSDDTLPKDRFSPSEHGKIVSAHHDLWDTAYAQGKEAADKLGKEELRTVLSSDQTEAASSIKAADNIFRRDDLFDKIKPEITVSDDIRYHTQHPLSSLEALAEIEEEKGHFATFHASASESDLYNFYYNKFIQGTATNRLFLIKAIEDVFGVFPKHTVTVEGVEKEEYIHNRNFPWANIVNEDPNVTAAKKNIIKEALIAAIHNQWSKMSDLVEDHGFTKTPGYTNVQNVTIAEIFISNPFTNGFRKEVLPEAAFNELKTALLANPETFASLTPQCHFNGADVNGLAKAFIDENRIDGAASSKEIFHAVFENSDFKALIKSSSDLSKELKKICTHNLIKNAAKSDFYLDNLVKELTKNEPDGIEDYRSFQLVLRLFGNTGSNAGFIENLKKLQYKDEKGTHAPLYEQLLNLHTKARFYDAVRKEENFFMFAQLWLKHKTYQPTQDDLAKKSTQDFLNLILFVQASHQEKLYNWLQKSPTECRYLINLLITNELFRNDFIAKANPATLELLLLRADHNDLVTLLLQSKKLNKEYFETLGKENLSPGAKETVEIRRFKAILFAASKYDLALLITSNIQFLEIVNKLGLYESYKDQIDKALKYVNFLLPINMIAELKNVSDATRERIEALYAKVDKASVKKYNREIEEQEDAKTLAIAATIKTLLTSKEKTKDQATGLEAEKWKEVDSTLIKVLLQHRNLLRRILQSASKTQIVSIFENIGKRKEDVRQGESLLTNFANTILTKGLADPIFWKRIDGDELRGQLSHYASPELIAKILRTRSVIDSLSFGWSKGLTRVAEDQKLFETFLPSLQNLPGFTGWFFTYANTHNDYHSSTSGATLITSQVLTSLMENRELKEKDFPRKAFFELFSRQYKILFPGEVAIRDVLLSSDKARENFRALAKGHPDTILELCIEEAKLNKNSPLLTEWLKEPFINYVIENSDVNSIEDLVEEFEILGLENKKGAILGRVIASATANDDTSSRLLNSEKLLPSALEHCLASRKDLAMDFLLKMFNDPIDERFIPLVPSYVGKFVELFNDQPNKLDKPDQGSRLIKLFLQLIHYFNQMQPETDLQQERSALMTLLKNGNLNAMLSSDIDPGLHQQLFIALFAVFGNEVGGRNDDLYAAWLPHPQEVSARANLSALRKKLFSDPLLHESTRDAINAKLDGLPIATNTAALKAYLNALSADQLIELYCASFALVKSGANPDHFSFTFKQEIKNCYLKHIFLNASGEKLCGLLESDASLISDYMRFAKELPAANPAENLREIKAVAIRLGKDLRSNILLDKVDGPWILRDLICNSDPSQIALQFEFLNSDPGLYQQYLEIFKVEDRIRFFADFEPELLKANIVEIIKKENTADDLAAIIGSFDIVENNPVTNFLRQLLMGDVSEVRSKFVSYLNGSVKLREAFFLSLASTSSSKDIFELLLRDQPIEGFALDYFEKSEALDATMGCDIRGEVPNAEEEFKNYFLNSPNKRRIYKLLNKNASDSVLVRIIDQTFIDEVHHAMLFLADEPAMTSVELAEIYNFEAKGVENKVKDGTPLTDRIVSYDPYFQHMIRELYAIDPNFIYPAPAILDRLHYSAGRRSESVANAKAVLNNFSVDAKGLRFKVDGQQITETHEYLYFYAHHVDFLGEAIRKQAARRGVNRPSNADVSRRTNEFYPDYEQYLTSLNQLVTVTQEGLVFKATRSAVPEELSILYFEALARYLYQPKQEFKAKDLLEAYPAFAKGLFQTLLFDENGKAHLRSEETLVLLTPEASEGLHAVPVYYSNTALYAYACLHRNGVEAAITPNMALAFLQSVAAKDLPENAGSNLVFAGVTDVENPHSWIEEPYLTFVKASIQLLLNNSPQVFNTVSNLKTLVAMLDEDIVLEEYEPIFKLFLGSVNFDFEGKVRFKTTNEEVPDFYCQKLIDVLRSKKDIKDPILHLLKVLTRNTDQVTPVTPRALLGMLCLKDQTIKFKDTDITVPQQWMNVALNEIKAMIENNTIVGVQDFEIFRLISQLDKEYFFAKFKEKPGFAGYIMDIIKIKVPEDKNFSKIPKSILNWVYHYTWKVTDQQRHPSLRSVLANFVKNYEHTGREPGNYEKIILDAVPEDSHPVDSQRARPAEAPERTPQLLPDPEVGETYDVGSYPGQSNTPSTLTHFFDRKRGGGAAAAASPAGGDDRPNVFEHQGYGAAPAPIPAGTPTTSRVGK